MNLIKIASLTKVEFFPELEFADNGDKGIIRVNLG